MGRKEEGYWECVQDFLLHLLPYLKAVSVYDRRGGGREGMLEEDIAAYRRRVYTGLVEFVDLEWRPVKDRICLKAIYMLMDSIKRLEKIYRFGKEQE